MKEKNTKELNEVLGKTHLSDFEKYCAENKESVSDNAEAYAKVPRDALLMIAFNERPGSILDVNDLLNQKGLQPLRTSGVQD